MTTELVAGAGTGRWSIAALVLTVGGVLAATWLIVASDGDPAHVVWWLVVVPVAIALLPVLVPVRPARIGAMLAMGAWCALTGFSIGFLLLPSLAALVGTVLREEA
jgi:hypothetical protein